MMDPQGMRCACVDIGSNTTRLLVADVEGGVVRQVAGAKAYTRLDRVPEIVAGQVEIARSARADRLRVVATAGVRAAADAPALAAAIEARAGVPVDVLDPSEEAALAFAGATGAPGWWPDRVAVVDVGGGSTEIAVGTVGRGVDWSASVPVGSRSPARLPELTALRPPPVAMALAVGGSATSTARLAGPRIDAASARVALGVLEAGGASDLDAERIRLLPAGLSILVAVSELLGRPLEIGAGGLREGVCIELASPRDG